jgi:hypothetical protein
MHPRPIVFKEWRDTRTSNVYITSVFIVHLWTYPFSVIQLYSCVDSKANHLWINVKLVSKHCNIHVHIISSMREEMNSRHITILLILYFSSVIWVWYIIANNQSSKQRLTTDTWYISKYMILWHCTNKQSPEIRLLITY